jgi:hypothetical protein
MSELGSHKGNGIRYIMHLSAPNGGVGQILRHPDGNWVPHENYAHLKGEVGRLRKELEESQENYHLVNELAGKEMTRLKAELARLRASSFVTAVPVEHYERIIKAGDAVALDYAERIEIEAGNPAKTLMKTVPVLRDWNAAKEGKSV